MTTMKGIGGLGRALASATREIRREDAYKARTDVLIVRDYHGDTRRIRVGDLHVIDADPAVVSHDLFTGKTTVKARPERFLIQSNTMPADVIEQRLRKPRAIDMRKVARLDERIRALMAERRDMVALAWARGAPVSADAARAAALVNRSVAKRGYPTNARPAKV
jgi:hypothetical protein